jgi:hypothetical protein
MCDTRLPDHGSLAAGVLVHDAPVQYHTYIAVNISRVDD